MDDERHPALNVIHRIAPSELRMKSAIRWRGRC